MRRGWVTLEIKDVRWRLDQGHLHSLLEHPETNMSRPGVEPEPPASQASHSLHISVGANAVFLRIYFVWDSGFCHNEWSDKSFLYLFSHSLTFDCGGCKIIQYFRCQIQLAPVASPITPCHLTPVEPICLFLRLRFAAYGFRSNFVDP